MKQRIQTLFQQYREQILYLFFGGCTTVVSFFSYFALTRWASLGNAETLANTIANLIAIIFAYITNRTWVFENKAHSVTGILREILSFFGGRLLTMLMENALIYLFVEQLHWPDLPVKLAATILVIIANYFISKWVVFRAERKDR